MQVASPVSESKRCTVLEIELPHVSMIGLSECQY